MARDLTVVVSDLAYTECPRWHDGRVWFVDFYTYRVLSAAEDGSDLRVEAEVPAQPSGLGWLPDGRLLVVSMRDARLLRREADGTLVTHAELGDHVTGHPNDMVVGAEGRAYVGNFGFDLMGGADVAPTTLLRVDPDGTVTTVADDLWFPNGSVITDDGLLLVDETFGNRISAFDIAADGSLGARRVWADLGEVPPDGITFDADGAVWVASVPDRCCLRVAEGGAVLDRVEADRGAFACVLGGDDGRTLFVVGATWPGMESMSDATAWHGTVWSAPAPATRAGWPGN